MSRTGRSRLDSHEAAFTRWDRCSRLMAMSWRRRMPRTVGIRPTAVYGLIMRSPAWPSALDGGQPLERCLDLVGRVLVVRQLSGQVGLVSRQVEEAVAA